jgi:hypothetical protein
LELELEARRRKVTAEANEREIIVAQKAGALVPIATINLWFAEVIIRARDMLLRVGGELADRLAAEDSPAKCREMIDGEVARALNVLRVMGRDGLPLDVETEQEHGL